MAAEIFKLPSNPELADYEFTAAKFTSGDVFYLNDQSTEPNRLIMVSYDSPFSDVVKIFAAKVGEVELDQRLKLHQLRKLASSSHKQLKPGESYGQTYVQDGETLLMLVRNIGDSAVRPELN